MANFSCYCYIGTGLGPALTYVDKKASWGSWETEPPRSIPAGTYSVVFRLKDKFGPAGSEGWVTYRAEDGTIIKMSFACPTLSGDNYARIECSNDAPYDCSVFLQSNCVPESGAPPSFWNCRPFEGELAKRGHPTVADFAINYKRDTASA